MRRQSSGHTLQTTELIHKTHLKISPETINRDWEFARMWLLRELANTG